ncbi:hypothetical protein HNY73_003856 [Argiope bruennichi]|uniref:Uncharacterized protein n=1 Tax=Argiope bruennichi TaxID=94029 RepID=A0A8T0FNU8_ARGBR|nr:hypothetical protein HNY73_003856 [Argiope bruennichi]
MIHACPNLLLLRSMPKHLNTMFKIASASEGADISPRQFPVKLHPSHLPMEHNSNESMPRNPHDLLPQRGFFPDPIESSKS